jgi:hypothetical protein
MNNFGGLEEALREPLVEGSLELDIPSRIERSEDDIIIPPEDEVPVVTIGKPRAWDVIEPPKLSTDAPQFLPQIRPEERAFLLRMACSFRPRADTTSITWARFTASLIPNEAGEVPIALDLYPISVETESTVSKNISLSPSLKFCEVEIGLGAISRGVEYPTAEPIISSGGLHESLLSWDFSESNGSSVRGGKLLLAVLVAPRTLQRINIEFSLEADVRHRGSRLAAWLSGQSLESRMSDSLRAVAWQSQENG